MEAAKLLTKITEQKAYGDADAEALAKDQGYLPLLLTQAAFCMGKNLTYKAYYEKWKQSEGRFDSLLKADKYKIYPSTYHATISLSINRLTEPAKQMLYYCSHLSPDSIPYSLLQSLVTQTRESDGLKYDIALRTGSVTEELVQCGLLVPKKDHDNMETNSYNIHRAIQSVGREYWRRKTLKWQRKTDPQQSDEPVQMSEVKTWITSLTLNKNPKRLHSPGDDVDLMREEMLPHSKELQVVAKKIGIQKSTEFADLLVFQGQMHMRFGNFSEGKSQLEKALTILKEGRLFLHVKTCSLINR